MNTHSQRPIEHQPGIRDAAVSGIFAGLAGGIVMLFFLIAIGFLSGRTPAQVMGAFDTLSGLPMRGALNHLAVSSVYGALFALLTHGLAARLRSPRSAALVGLLYGILLWLVAETLLRQAAAILLAANPPAVFLLAHLAYGLTLGLTARRQSASLALPPLPR